MTSYARHQYDQRAAQLCWRVWSVDSASGKIGKLCLPNFPGNMLQICVGHKTATDKKVPTFHSQNKTIDARASLRATWVVSKCAWKLICEQTIDLSRVIKLQQIKRCRLFTIKSADLCIALSQTSRHDVINIKLGRGKVGKLGHNPTALMTHLLFCVLTLQSPMAQRQSSHLDYHQVTSTLQINFLRSTQVYRWQKRNSSQVSGEKCGNDKALTKERRGHLKS